MISLVRVDDRLIHGQITVGWVPHLKASHILVVNDRLAGDPVLSAILKAGGTAEADIDVVTIEESALLFKRGAMDHGRLIVLFENLKDACRAVEAGLRFATLNVGGIRGSGDGLRVGDAVVLSDADQELLREIIGKGIAVEVRLMPGDRPRRPLQKTEEP